MPEKINVYFMPGMAAGPEIFEKIVLPPEKFTMHFLKWLPPTSSEDLRHYAKRISAEISKPNPVLIGVSFGGILVQVMAQFLDPLGVVIISSVKSRNELPPRMKVTARLKAYRWLPKNIFGKIEFLAALSQNSKFKQKIALYKKYHAIGDDDYLRWAIQKVVEWDRTEADKNVIHIHGTKDEVFPPRYIPEFIPVKDGTHIMILNKYHWLNENLPRLILERSFTPRAKH